VKRRLNNSGIEPVGSASRADFVKFIREDMQRWAKVLKDAGVQLD
jgi:tripartite-type tricarboxylate transporter receptor subunit TctC